MTRVSLAGLRGELVIDRQVTPVSYLSDMDAAWTFTDSSGHRHHCEYDAADHYPTLALVTGPSWWCEDCDDEHQDSRLECRQCGEEITPGQTGPGVEYIPGLVTCTLNGEEISRDEAMALVRSWNDRG